MTARLLLISHAATAAMRGGRFPGSPVETALDAVDLKSRHEQAALRALRQRLAGPVQEADFAAFSSPAACARDTAGALGLTAQIEASLADMDYGRWHGRRLADFAAGDMADMMQWQRDAKAAPHGGESFEAVLARVGAWLDAYRGSARTAVAITHAPVIRAALIQVLDAPPASFARIEVAPLSVIELRLSAALEWRWWAAQG